MRNRREILVPHRDGVAMGTGVEHDPILSRQRAIHKDRLPIERPERWHGAAFTIGIQPPEFVLVCQSERPCAGDPREAVEVDLEVSRNDRLDWLTIGEPHDGFRPVTAGHVRDGRFLLGRVRRGVWEDCVRDVRASEKFLNGRNDCHKASSCAG